MKLSTDAVMLGSLANHPNPKNILDIGTGTGVIALMLAQRYKQARVYGVELDPEASVQAQENVAGSPWNSRMEIYQSSFQEFSSIQKQRYDLMVSNPPFFARHLLSGNEKKNMALHDQTLSFPDIWAGVDRCLAEDGFFWVILPPMEMDLFKRLGKESGFMQYHKTQVRDRPEVKIHRCIGAFRRSKIPEEGKIDDLTIKDENGDFSIQYRKLARDFLLNF